MYEMKIENDEVVRMGELKTGDIAILEPGESYGGSVVVRAGRDTIAFFSLTNPMAWWTGSPEMYCRKLKPGTVVTLTVK